MSTKLKTENFSGRYMEEVMEKEHMVRLQL